MSDGLWRSLRGAGCVLSRARCIVHLPFDARVACCPVGCCSDVACCVSDVAAIAAEIGLVGTLLSVLRQYSDEPTTAATSNTRKSLFVRPAQICAGTGLTPARRLSVPLIPGFRTPYSRYSYPLFPLFVPLIPVIRAPYSRSSIPLINSQVHCCRARALLAQHDAGRAAFEKEWDEAAGACAGLT
jgi:hypothetical protein